MEQEKNYNTPIMDSIMNEFGWEKVDAEGVIDIDFNDALKTIIKP